MATCPQQAFLRYGLRINERELLRFEAREQGDWVHELLAEFHREALKRHGSWQALTPEAAAQLLRELARGRNPSEFSGPRRSFLADRLRLKLERFVAETVAWLPGYGFAPTAAEAQFGGRQAIPALELTLGLGQGERLVVEGKIDRLDSTLEGSSTGDRWILLDYKSSNRRWNSRAFEAGLEIQLPLYALALEAGGRRVVGMAYVGLSARLAPARNRGAEMHASTFPHSGRFSVSVLSPRSNPAVLPFKWKLKKNGEPMATGDLRTEAEFAALLDATRNTVVRLGRAWLGGDMGARPNPVADELPCERCEMRACCRI
jgi:ATP-dependent helicase/nuclease subunit B